MSSLLGSFSGSCNWKKFILVFFLWAGFLFAESPRENILRYVERIAQGLEPSWAGEVLYSKTALTRFYQNRLFEPIWLDGLRPAADVADVLKVLSELDRSGLRPADYHLELLQELHQALLSDQVPDLEMVSAFEIFLSDAWLMAAAHLSAGRVDPVTFDVEWHAQRAETRPSVLLETAHDLKRRAELLMEQEPVAPEYKALKELLARLRAAQKEAFPKALSDSFKVEPGQSHPELPLLAERLRFFLKLEKTPEHQVYSIELLALVKQFQVRHGLDVDGKIGPKTRKMLNLSLEDRIAITEMNMERWRWLPRDLGLDHIRVNIAGFTLQVVEENKVAMAMDVIVGRDYRQTPVFSGRMTYLVLSPYWNVPPSLAVKDKLPALRKNASDLSAQGFRAYSGADVDAPALDPRDVDWSKVSSSGFSYRLRQDPGPNNALGAVKFMFPNPYHVYLHDTPGKELFAKSRRAFSSGCIRLSKPLDLVAYLLRDQEIWTPEKVNSVIDSRIETVIRLKKPLPVHLEYWTLWVDEEGRDHWREDIYQRDAKLSKAWQEQAPRGGGS